MAYSFSAADLAEIDANYVALCKAMALGITKYSIGDKRVEYGTMAEMMTAKRNAEDILVVTEANEPRYSTAAFFR